jgi:hypothetical protein
VEGPALSLLAGQLELDANGIHPSTVSDYPNDHGAISELPFCSASWPGEALKK